ncbi:unnamed protein product [Closterium sp. NIES-54]
MRLFRLRLAASRFLVSPLIRPSAATSAFLLLPLKSVLVPPPSALINPPPPVPPRACVLAWQFVFYLLDVALTTATWIVGKLTSSLAVANVPPAPPLPLPLPLPLLLRLPLPRLLMLPLPPPLFPSRPASRLVHWELRFPSKLCKRATP